MKKRYDAVVIGGGVAGYALAAIAARQGHVLVFENEEPPVDIPWHRPLVATGPDTVWARFVEALPMPPEAPSPFRFQVLAGRERPDGYEPPPAEPWDGQGEWLDRRLTWQPFLKRLFSGGRKVAPPALQPAPWLSLPTGVAPDESAVSRYLAAGTATWETPGGDLVALLRRLRASAARDGAEFLPLSRLDAVEPGRGFRVEGAAALLESPAIAVALSVGEWMRTAGLGPLPRKVFRHVRQNGLRVRARWNCDESELSVGLAARGWFSDGAGAFFEVTGDGSDTVLTVWTVEQGGAEVDQQAVAAGLRETVLRYCPFFKGTIDSASVDAHPVWRSQTAAGTGIPAFLGKLAYAGPQSYPGWGVEGELAAALRVVKCWFPPEQKT